MQFQPGPRQLETFNVVKRIKDDETTAGVSAVPRCTSSRDDQVESRAGIICARRSSIGRKRQATAITSALVLDFYGDNQKSLAHLH